MLADRGSPTRAQEFYDGRLGLPYDADERRRPTRRRTALAGGSQLVLRLLPEAQPVPQHGHELRGRPTCAAEIADARGRGVTFEDYDTARASRPSATSSTTTAMKAAWFLDPDGNVLCLPPTARAGRLPAARVIAASAW